MKLNRKLILILALVISVAMATSGTLAFLTDRDSETNVFTVGNVDIDLSENFEQGATLIPGETVDKVPVITNTGNNEAWVWMTVSIPCGMEVDGNPSKNLLHWNWMSGTDADYMDSKTQSTIDTYIANGWLPAGTTIEQVRAGDNWNVDEKNHIAIETIDGVDYYVYLFKYNSKLVPGETTLGSFCQVYMDAHIDIKPDGTLCWIDNGNVTELAYNINTMGNPKVYVAAYAMQADGFASVDDAYNAYGKQWGENSTATYTDSAKDTAEAQKMLDNAKPGDVIMLTPGVNYGTLYIRQNLENSNISKPVESNWAGGGHSFHRTVNGLTILGAKGATLESIKIEAGTYAPGGNTHSQNIQYLNSTIDLNNITIKDVEFTGTKTALSLASQHGSYDGITFDGCTLKAKNVSSANAIRLFFDDGQNDTSKNLTVKNCFVSDAWQVIEIRPTENVVITSNTFENIVMQNLLLSSVEGKTYKNVQITNNTATGLTERFLRAASVDGITVTGNTIANYNGGDNDIIKLTKTLNATVSGNTLPSGYTVTIE